MILTEMQLRNIRSYVELEPFQFPQGTSLFYGGVGSGKSSLLYAIEFALFGLGELKGPDLLRNSATEGLVSLTFEEDGKEYIVQRKLGLRRATVSQVDGAISEDGELHHYDSVTEMKSRVLEILKLNEKPQAGTSSVIYRYGIFTPQEEIKKIMEANPEGRLETLRRAFRLEKYATTRDNAQALSNRLEKVEIKVLEKQIEGLDEKKNRRDALNKQIEINNNELVRLKEELGEINKDLNTILLREKELEEALKEIQNSKAQIPLIREQCKENQQLLNRLNDEFEKFKQDKAQYMDELKRLQSLPKPTDKSEGQLEAELRELQEKQNALAVQRGASETSLHNYEMLIDKGVCPTCERPIDDPSAYEEKCNKMQQEATTLLDKEKEIKGKGHSLDSLLQGLRQYNIATKNLLKLQEEIDSKANAIVDKADEIQRVQSRLSESQTRQKQLEESVKPNEELLDEHAKAIQERKEKEGEAHKRDTDMALLKQKNGALEEDRIQLEDEISEGEAALKKILSYREVVKYVEQYFIPTIEKIERIVLQRIHEDFNDAFQKYFSMIIGLTDIEAYIDEDFSVVVMQGDYEMPYYRLSGGERTSMALAYRLALNQLIRKLSKLEGGLLILDEPTEGLSYAQVLNLREVFDDLDCNQIVLVSHEPQFLGFSDKVFRVEKTNNISIAVPA